MASVDPCLRLLLQGESVPIPHVDVRVAEAESFQPITKLTVGYIACGVLLNEKNEVLMMQEAKRSCYGSWYLPAGRVEPGENLVDAVRREVLEETGLECEPTTLIMVECGSSVWHRFTFTGRVTGGKLKTTKEKDAESLQARWMDMDTIKSSQTELRAFDILKLIKCAQQYHSKSPDERHANLLPAVQDHSILQMRFVVVHHQEEQKPKVLVNTKNGPHFPVGMLAPRDRSSALCRNRVLKHAFGKPVDLKLCGLLSVEHCGVPSGEHDGLCHTLLFSFSKANGEIPPFKNSDYEWLTVEDANLQRELLSKIDNDMMVPFVDLH